MKMEVLLIILVLFAVAIPTTYLAERKYTGSGAAILSLVAMISFILILSIIPSVLDPANNHRYVETYYWIPQINASFSLFLDGISLSLASIALVIIAAVSAYSHNYMQDRKNLGQYYALTTLLSLGLMGIFITSNLLLFYFFWELILIPSYFIIGEWGSHDSYGIAFKFIIITHAGAVLVLLGIGSAFVETGSLDIFQVQSMLTTMQSGITIWMLIALTVGFAVKLAVVPAHIWLPDTYSEAPAPMSALLGGVMTTAGAYGILRLSLGMVYSALNSMDFKLSFIHILAIFGVASALFGSLLAISEKDVNRLLAYSSISHMGYVVFGLSLFPNPLAIIAVVLHLLNHGISKGLFFLSTGEIVKQTGTRIMDDIGGVGSQMPVIGTSSAIAALSIGGVPPFACFISEFFIFMSAFQVVALDSFFLVPTLLMLSVNVFSLAYSTRFVGNVLLGPVKNSKLHEKSKAISAIALILVALIIIIGLMPTIFTEFIALVSFQN
ncbi:MAG: NuoM family protein [Candidatus Thorarchaeota archaeon]